MELRDFGNDAEKKIKKYLGMKDPVQQNPYKYRDQDDTAIEIKV